MRRTTKAAATPPKSTPNPNQPAGAHTEASGSAFERADPSLDPHERPVSVL
jgi:hypothetical protein